MYMVGAYAVSTLSGMRFADFVSSRIFKPLDMDSSTYSIDVAVRTGRFTDTWTSFGRLIPHWLQEEYVDLMAGPAGVISSSEELVPWVRMLLNGGVDPNTNATIISPAEFDVITSGHSIVSPAVSETRGQPGFSTELYGLGWTTFSYAGHNIIMHEGAAPGVSAVIAAALEDGLAVVALANADAKQPPMIDIALLVAEKAFGLRTGISSSSPSTNTSILRRTTSNSRRRAGEISRANGTAAPHDVDLAGTYYNPGYGTAVLCGVHSPSSFCQSILDDFRSVDKSLSANSTDLFVSWKTTWSSYLRFTHTIGNQYMVYTGRIYPEGYGRNSTPFSIQSTIGLATFVVGNKSAVGFGITGISGVNRSGPVEEASDVWFVKQA